MKHIYIILLLLVIPIFIVVYGVGMQRDISGKAARGVVVKEGLLPTLYLALLHPVTAGKPIDVGVFINTAGIETAQADVLLLYDPAVLRLEETDVERLPEYRTINREQPVPGKMTINLFTADSVSTKFVTSTTDIPVAILHFKPLTNKVNTTVNLFFDRAAENTSGIYPPRGQAGGVVNILSSVKSVSMTTQ